MLPLMTVATAPTPEVTTINRWLVSLYAGIFTAVVALVLVLVTNIPILAALIGLLIGIAPILAYQVALGTLGRNWRPVIAGLIGYVLFLAALFLPSEAVGWAVPVLGLLSMIIWPLIVGAMMRDQSVGRLFLASLIGLVLGVAAAFITGLILGQDPYAWVGLAGILFFSFWGGTVGAALAAWRRPV